MTKEEQLMINLQAEIHHKCTNLKHKKREQQLLRLFFFACISFVIIPTILVFAGVTLLTILSTMVIYLGFSIIILCPFILNSQNVGGYIK